MSDSHPKPAAKGFSRSSKYLFVLLLGLVVGVVATVMIGRMIEEGRDKFPGGMMQVLQHHAGELRNDVKQNRCNATDSLPHLQALRTLANDLEPAFPTLASDQRFADSASKLRGALDAALASPPMSCEGLGTTLQTVGDSCKNCHQNFRG